MAENLTLERLAMALTENGARAAIRIVFQLTTDSELLTLHEGGSAVAGNPVADLVRAEMEHRGIDA